VVCPFWTKKSRNMRRIFHEHDSPVLKNFSLSHKYELALSVRDRSAYLALRHKKESTVTDLVAPGIAQDDPMEMQSVTVAQVCVKNDPVLYIAVRWGKNGQYTRYRVFYPSHRKYATDELQGIGLSHMEIAKVNPLEPVLWQSGGSEKCSTMIRGHAWQLGKPADNPQAPKDKVEMTVKAKCANGDPLRIE
jgi:hypothetical protein